MTTADIIRVDRPTTSSKVFAHTRWDAIPVLASLFHLAYFLGLFFLYPHMPLWVMLILGLVYSLMVNANINGVGHNFIHNRAFCHVSVQLALHHLLFSTVFLPRTLFQLSERLF